MSQSQDQQMSCISTDEFQMLTVTLSHDLWKDIYIWLDIANNEGYHNKDVERFMNRLKEELGIE